MHRWSIAWWGDDTVSHTSYSGQLASVRLEVRFREKLKRKPMEFPSCGGIQFDVSSEKELPLERQPGLGSARANFRKRTRTVIDFGQAVLIVRVRSIAVSLSGRDGGEVLVSPRARTLSSCTSGFADLQSQGSVFTFRTRSAVHRGQPLPTVSVRNTAASVGGRHAAGVLPRARVRTFSSRPSRCVGVPRQASALTP